MKKIILIFSILILTGCNSNEINVALDYQANTNHIGILIAKELGYYDKLNVNIIPIGEMSPEILVDSNRASFGISYSENVLQGQENNLDIESIYAIYNNNYSGFMSHKDKNITSINDLANKTYCGWGSNVESTLIKDIAKNNGIDPNSIRIQNSSLGFFNTPKDECDFFWEYKGWSTTIADYKDIKYNFLPINDYGLNFYTPVIISNSKVDPSIKKEFISATNKGYLYAIENPEIAVDILSTFNPNIEKEIFINSLNTVKDNINKTGFQNENIWNDFNTWMKNNNIVTNIKKPYTNEYITKDDNDKN